MGAVTQLDWRILGDPMRFNAILVLLAYCSLNRSELACEPDAARLLAIILGSRTYRCRRRFARTVGNDDGATSSRSVKQRKGGAHRSPPRNRF
jgi:hypothetical protein